MHKIFMNKFIIAALLFFPVVGACSMLSPEPQEPLTAEQVEAQIWLTTMDNVKDPAAAQPVPEALLTDEMEEEFADGAELVLTPFTNVNNTTVGINLDAPVTSVDSLIDLAFDIGGLYIPGLAVWEGIAALLFKRKRRHYSNAVKAVNPMAGGSVDLMAAVKSVGAGLGVVHSSPATEKTFNKEVAKEIEEA